MLLKADAMHLTRECYTGRRLAVLSFNEHEGRGRNSSKITALGSEAVRLKYILDL